MEFTDYGEDYNELGFLVSKTIKGAVRVSSGVEFYITKAKLF